MRFVYLQVREHIQGTVSFGGWLMVLAARASADDASQARIIEVRCSSPPAFGGRLARFMSQPWVVQGSPHGSVWLDIVAVATAGLQREARKRGRHVCSPCMLLAETIICKGTCN